MNKYVLLLLISGIWGSQFFFIALVIENVGVITLSAIKACIGGICLLFFGFFYQKKSEEYLGVIINGI
ncbi:EamA family transporter [Peribacillus simplex]|uniref:EamA family transporter n=1 Tax=Peribacillus simplex TaxID=1478 RepID=UPI00366FC04B